MQKGDTITASEFNSIRAKIAAVLGSGGTNPNTGSSDATFGYGQTLSSYEVAQYADITLTDIHNLRSDLVKARRHQTGIDFGASSRVNSDEYLAFFTQDSDITASDWTKYNTSADRAVTNRLVADESSSLDLETYADAPLGGSSRGGDLDTRTSTWSSSLMSEVQIDFNSYDEARYYFNAGGKIIIIPSLSYSGSDGKTVNWKNLLNEYITSIRFSANLTESFPRTANKKTTTNKGYYQLTTGFQEIFRKSGDSDYTGNNYRITAAVVSGGARLLFRIYFEDDYSGESYTVTDPNTGVVYTVTIPDTPVLGTLSSEIQQLRPTNPSTSYVRVTGPISYRRNSDI